MSYNRNAETQRRLKKKCNPRYRTPIYFDEEKGRYIRCYFRSKGYRAFLKKQSVRKIRHSKETYQEKGRHRRQFDFWWELL